MEQESFEYILNIEHRPNKTAVLLAIPMYRYRIETYSIEYGVNFFQKAVLMFKTKPGIENSTISNCLGLHENLVNEISEQLVNKRLIGPDGRLTEKGRELKNDIDGLIVNKNKKSIGYVFQHINDDTLYAFYVNNIRKATVLNGDICTGTKGESGDEDYYVTPILADKLLEERRTNYAPSERDVLGLIKRSNKHSHSNKDVEVIPVDTKNYGISFIPDNHPSIVWVCTYAYVPHIKDDIYGSEWDIQDPFGFENNSELKLYVESLISDGLIEDFTYNFKDLKTENDQTIDAFQAMMDEMVEKEMDSTFDLGYHKLDKNVKRYLKAMLKNYLLLKRTVEIDLCENFIINIQRAFETIIKIDFENNENIYRRVYNEIKFENRLRGGKTDFYSPQSRIDYIDELLYTGGLKADAKTEKKIKDLAKDFDPRSANALKHYLLKLLFSIKYKPNNPLYDILKERVGVIYEIAFHRNMSGHGQTSNEEKQQRCLTMEEIDKYLNTTKQIINNYITCYNG
mgnify:CR=1 FL=1